MRSTVKNAELVGLGRITDGVIGILFKSGEDYTSVDLPLLQAAILFSGLSNVLCRAACPEYEPAMAEREREIERLIANPIVSPEGQAYLDSIDNCERDRVIAIVQDALSSNALRLPPWPR